MTTPRIIYLQIRRKAAPVSLGEVGMISQKAAAAAEKQNHQHPAAATAVQSTSESLEV